MDTRKELFKIDSGSKLPLYDQIERNLRDLIINGQLQAGQMVPSEWDLSELYGVSRLTVRKALEELVRQNWLERKHGVGTYVRQPALASIAASKLSFTEQMKAIGRRPGSRLVEHKVVPATVKIARALRLQQAEPLFEITRVRLADEIPILLETSCLSQQRFASLATRQWPESDSAYDRVQRRRVARARPDRAPKQLVEEDSQGANVGADFERRGAVGPEPQQQGHSEVEDLRLCTGVDQDVLGTKSPVGDRAFVGLLHLVADRDEKVQARLQLQALLVAIAVDAHAVDVRCRPVDLAAAGQPGGEQAGDVGVDERRQCFAQGGKPLQEVAAIGTQAQQPHRESFLAPTVEPLGQVNAAIPAGGDELPELGGTDAPADPGVTRWAVARHTPRPAQELRPGRARLGF